MFIFQTKILPLHTKRDNITDKNDGTVKKSEKSSLRVSGP
jgi:hypothetical protein